MRDRKLNAGDSDEVAAMDQRIAKINAEREKLLQQKQDILNIVCSQQAQTRLTTEKKISVFKNLFKGRTDIFATRWQNSQGRSGYSVACNNEWVQDIYNCTRPPWEQGAKIKPTKIENCPEQITVTLANHIYFKLNEILAPIAARLNG